VDRPPAYRGCAQPRRAALARALGHRAPAGAWDRARRRGAVVRHDALGAVGAADDQSEFADDGHGRRRLPDQHALGLCGGERAVPHLARGCRRRRGVLFAACREKRGGGGGEVRMSDAPSRVATAILTAALLALFACAIFGPLTNLLLWAFAEKWYFPSKLP